MIFSLGALLGGGILYLMILFLVAYISDSGVIPVRFLRHPIVYVLSLGIYVSAWAIFGAVGFAEQMGYNFLAFYLGISASFLFAPVVLMPILKLTRSQRLGSLADLLTYRYRSQWVGTFSTIAMVISCLPIMAMQIQAVADSIGLLTHKDLPNTLALWFCVVIAAFTLLFGTRHLTPREKHEGLVVAMATESLIKLVALLILGGYAYWGILGGHAGLSDWLKAHPENLDLLYSPLRDSPWHTLMLAFLFSAVVMPFMYQMIFTENQNTQHLLKASWSFPLYLLLAALPIPLLLWAGIKLANFDIDPEYFTLAVVMASHSRALTLLAFVAGLSAASGVIIVTTLALASMLLHHVILPLYQPPPERNIYEWLLRMRRSLILFVIALSYLLFVALDKQHSLTEMGTITFIGTLQFAPGIVGTLFWPRANRQGFMLGLAAGMLIWLVLLVIPFLLQIELFHFRFGNIEFTSNPIYWQDIGLSSSLVNTVIYIFVSLLTRQSSAEHTAALNCSIDALKRPLRWDLPHHSIAEFQQALSTPLGADLAEREILHALQDLDMQPSENTPYALRRLRDQLESNLSGLFGPAKAQELMDQHIPYQIQARSHESVDIHYMESKLEEYEHRLSGVYGEINSLRRYQRDIIFHLPIGVCTLASDLEILNWNKVIAEYTGVPAKKATGSNLRRLPEPWCSLLSEFAMSAHSHIHRREIEVQGAPHWVSLNRVLVDIDHTQSRSEQVQVIVIEDITSTHMLESQLQHSERLASIGQLAAGVAHEIGNPVTAIACLAQDLKTEIEDSNVETTCIQIIEQTQRISRIVQSLVGFARGNNEHMARPFDTVQIRQCVEEAISLIRIIPDGRDYEFVNDCNNDAFIHGDRQKLMQVFVNLLSNARDASQPGERIIVRCEGNEHTLNIEVEDFGSGLSAQVRDHLFEPFVTSKEAGKGTGLGLTMVHGIISEHHGKIQLTDKSDYDQGQGVIVRMTLPGLIHETQNLLEH